MLCPRCHHRTASGAGALRPSPRIVVWAERLSSLVCDRCGAVLPQEDATDRLLGKLSQLARFGLAAEASPLLVPSRQAEGQ